MSGDIYQRSKGTYIGNHERNHWFIQAKVDKFIKTYDECVTFGNCNSLYDLFHINKRNGSWLCNETRGYIIFKSKAKNRLGANW